jgi:endonuclease IV
VSRFIGAHTIANGGIHMAALRAGNAGMTALQIFTAPPQYYGDKASMKPERVQRFRAALDEAGIRPEEVVVHGAYVLNTATDDETKWSRAQAGLRKELERSTALGVGSVCFHPGAATSGDREASTERHLFASGLDITVSEAALKRVLDDFEKAAGASPSFFHLNDSEGVLGSNKDKHLLIGDGRIGTEAFRWLLGDTRAAAIPLILETPQQHYDIADDDPSPDPYDLAMMKLLSSMMS